MTMFAADLASTGELRPEHTVDTVPPCTNSSTMIPAT
jgi:hypothetical protein